MPENPPLLGPVQGSRTSTKRPLTLCRPRNLCGRHLVSPDDAPTQCKRQTLMLSLNKLGPRFLVEGGFRLKFAGGGRSIMGEGGFVDV